MASDINGLTFFLQNQPNDSKDQKIMLLWALKKSKE